MTLAEWSALIGCLFDAHGGRCTLIPGPCLDEWAVLAVFDFDTVDRFLLDFETQGG